MEVHVDHRLIARLTDHVAEGESVLGGLFAGEIVGPGLVRRVKFQIVGDGAADVRPPEPLHHEPGFLGGFLLRDGLRVEIDANRQPRIGGVGGVLGEGVVLHQSPGAVAPEAHPQHGEVRPGGLHGGPVHDTLIAGNVHSGPGGDAGGVILVKRLPAGQGFLVDGDARPRRGVGPPFQNTPDPKARQYQRRQQPATAVGRGPLAAFLFFFHMCSPSFLPIDYHRRRCLW